MVIDFGSLDGKARKSPSGSTGSPVMRAASAKQTSAVSTGDEGSQEKLNAEEEELSSPAFVL